MDSFKSIVVVAILLGVLYGIYQVINDDESPVSPRSTNLMAEFDKEDSNADGKNDGDKDDSQSSDSSEKNDKPRGRNKSASPFSKPVSPPPSPINRTEFVFPKKKNSSSAKSFENDLATKNRQDQKPSPVFSTDRNSNNFGHLASNIETGTQPSTKSAPAFKEVGQGHTSANTALVSKSNDLGATQTSAESSINDPRNRFVKGSFTDFEKQVLGDMQKAEELIRENEFVSALKLLTKFYDDPRLTREENQNLASWLDPLAGKVIYSVEPHLVEPYYVRPNDTLQLLSVKFAVPAELIFNINRASIQDPQNLVPGTELKMVKGPFNAEISLTKRKMTLFVKDMYAGTFKIRIGSEPVPKTGKYRVLSKSRLGKDYTNQNHQTIEAGSPNNPYGNHYLNIGGEMAIHGSAQVSDSNDRRGCISLNAIDAKDVHNILTTESTIIIVE